MRVSFLAMFLSMSLARADFAEDQYSDHPDALLRIVTAAESDHFFKSSTDGQTALYLRSAEYIGPLVAPFGKVHVARLFYIRSAPQGTKIPSRGHTYVVFLDDKFKIRAFWPEDMPDEPSLSVDGAKLWADKALVFDYATLPHNRTTIFGGKVVGVPVWPKLGD